MSLITYATLLATLAASDARLLAVLASGDVTKTQDVTEANTLEAQCLNLIDAGLIDRYRRGREVDASGVTWYTIDGRVTPQAMAYLADLAKERLQLSRDPVPVV